MYKDRENTKDSQSSGSSISNAGGSEYMDLEELSDRSDDIAVNRSAMRRLCNTVVPLSPPKIWNSTETPNFNPPSPTPSDATPGDSTDEPAIPKLKLQKLKTLFSQPLDPREVAQLNPNNGNGGDGENRGALESFVADLFTSISAIKASYAQLQLAQSPYDPGSVQSSDQSVVSEFKRIAELKRSYLKNQISPLTKLQAFASQIQEQKNLVKTFQVTVKKLESELQSKDSELSYLKNKLVEIESKNQSLEAKLRPNKTLASLHNLHISALNPNHFLIALRFAVKSVRSFVKIMVKEMESAGWDLSAAAASIHDLSLNPEHRNFAFESFVCAKMFSDFNSKDLNFQFLRARSKWNQRQFFDEFNELKLLKPKEISKRNVEFGKFSFFGNSDSGRKSSDSDFYNGFMEVAKRVWLLHCLFFSFVSDLNGSIFQAKPGARFSEVFMESVADSDSDPISGSTTVGFTVVPGFRVGSTVIQCRVYLL
ncbi:uncharacterized protein LOC109833325 [Asparagus officinalis]|uniref:uncharacterized protein LOC109833325 n=1 Tax=Asparagus officinalis TaxID=4686 RepID=UPI00098E33D4|nr:uncharacterized protein LOC109833325 [Asparagus officinalis]